MNMMAQWEDETGNRQVQFSVDYTIENATVLVNDVTPTKVTIIDPTSNTTIKSMGVHTAKGQKMLADQFAKSGKLEDFINDIKPMLPREPLPHLIELFERAKRKSYAVEKERAGTKEKPSPFEAYDNKLCIKKNI